MRQWIYALFGRGRNNSQQVGMSRWRLFESPLSYDDKTVLMHTQKMHD
jgi:hypothetical protein